MIGAVPDVVLADSFDAITAWDLIEHLERPAVCARWIVDHLAPGGRVVVLTPDAASAFDRIAAVERVVTGYRSDRIERLCLNRYHLHRFSAAGLCRMFETAGCRTASLSRVQVFSLDPERYGSGFAPGIAGWTGIGFVDRLTSRLAHAAVMHLRVRNKLLYVGIKGAA